MEQYGEHQFIEELPFELEEESEESRSGFCFRLWEYPGKVNFLVFEKFLKILKKKFSG